MSYLIDTQILIWLFISPQKLPPKILKILKNIENDIFVSNVSIWEIAIKSSIGKLNLPFELKNIIQEISEMSINILEITSEHLIKVADLPFHHKDPFDRLIISQTIIENMPIISSDSNFKDYNIQLIWE
jgi:PIN domain nuclease of toxin-antitoxin system